MQLFDLTGRRAFVTGSSKGIGYAVSEGLAEAGADVVLNARGAAELKAAYVNGQVIYVDGGMLSVL